MENEILKNHFKNFVAPKFESEEKKPEPKTVESNSDELKICIGAYWFNYPQAKKMFIERLDMQPNFHNEYNTVFNYYQCDFETFKSISIN